MNSIQLGSNELVCVDYSDLLEKILRVLQNHKNQKLFKTSDDGKRLRIDIDAIASLAASLQVDNPLGSSANSVRCATVNFSPGSKERFPNQIREIRDCIKQLLESGLGNSSLIEFVANLVTDLQDFKGGKADLDFTYDFKVY